MTKKCVCGYVYQEDIKDDNTWGIISGDEKFISINGTFTINRDLDLQQVYLYSCPKCHMVQMSKY